MMKIGFIGVGHLGLHLVASLLLLEDALNTDLRAPGFPEVLEE